MTEIRLNTWADALGGKVPAAATLTITYSSARSTGSDVTLPRPITVLLTNGTPVTPIIVDPTPDDGYATVQITTRGNLRAITRTVEIPDVPTVDWADLADVNPATFQPVPPAKAASDGLVAGLIADPESLTAAQLDTRYGTRAKAEAILRAAPSTPDAVYGLSAESVTMSVGIASGAVTSSIPGGRWRAPKRVTPSGTAADISADTAFRISGTPSLDFGAGLPNSRYVTAPLLTGGALQAARFTPLFRFNYDGQTLELAFKCAVAGAVSFRLKVDGRYVLPTAAAGTTFTGGGEDLLTLKTNSAGALAAGSGYLVKFDFGTAKPRVIEFEGPSSFGGVWVEPTATVTPGVAARQVGAGFGDSIIGGAGISIRSENWVLRAGQLLGCDEVHNLAIGGTGFTVTAGVSNYLLRIPDLVAINPDIIFIDGGQNDQGATSAVFSAAVAEFFTALRAALPNAFVYVLGMWTPGNSSQTRITMNETLRAAAASFGYGFIDMIDPTGKGRTAPAWAPATAYVLGDLVRNGTTPYLCTAAHTSGGTFDLTKWRATSWIFGTGKTGATTGDGNADRFIQGVDGIHQTPAANDMMERLVAEAALRILHDVIAAP